MTGSFIHDVTNPGAAIADAKRVVALTTHASDEALRKAAAIVRSLRITPATCGHPKKELSSVQIKTNALLERAACQIEAEMMDDVPF